MGKGDLKSRKGKIARGSHGNTRKKHKSSAVVIPTPKPEKAKKAANEVVAEKPKAAKKPGANAATTKKPAAKKAAKTTDKDSE
jgi:30S ribosomal protein S31